MEDGIVCDIDGTLALRKNRGPFEWSMVGEDDVNRVIADLVSVYYHDANVAVILLSGRDSVCRPETEQWLAENSIPYTELLMRKEGDHRKDTIVKVELYKKHVKGQYKVRFVLDDRNQMVQAWRRLKLTCLQVADGDF